MSEYRSDAPTYQPDLDFSRLSRQIDRIKALMLDGAPRTIQEITRIVGGSETGNSGLVRDLRKPRNGGFIIKSARRGDPRSGLWEYWLPGAP